MILTQHEAVIENLALIVFFFFFFFKDEVY